MMSELAPFVIEQAMSPLTFADGDDKGFPIMPSLKLSSLLATGSHDVAKSCCWISCGETELKSSLSPIVNTLVDNIDDDDDCDAAETVNELGFEGLDNAIAVVFVGIFRLHVLFY